MSSIEGLDALTAWLEGLSERVLDGAAAGLAQGLAETAALAKELAPVKTGALRDSIDFAVTRGGDGVQGSVWAGAKHAADVEFGGPQPARPFLYPAFKMTRERIRRAVQQGVREKLGGG